ncbi:MAG: MarR family winged helix-turn-helix transcriptional regulator [Janthinobacterium lividum]
MTYVLEDNVGFLLRQVTQRHLSLFSATMCHELTPTQFSALLKLHEQGSVSQNQLGRLTAMDAPTIKGVVDRLMRRDLVSARPDSHDARLLMLSLTEAGERVVAEAIPRARQVTEATLAPLRPGERKTLLSLLNALR